MKMMAYDDFRRDNFVCDYLGEMSNPKTSQVPQVVGGEGWVRGWLRALFCCFVEDE
jgi:hypothetical protein